MTGLAFCLSLGSLAVGRTVEGAEGMPPGAVVEVAPEKAEYFLGEPTYVRFILKNEGENEIRIERGSDYRGASRPLRFKFRAWDEAGNEVPDPDPMENFMGGIGGPQKIKPGETHEQRLLLQSWCGFESAGTYRVGVACDFGWGDGDPEWSSTYGFKRTPLGEFKVIVRKPTSQQAKVVLDGMVDGLRKGQDGGTFLSPAFAFRVIRSPVYLPHLIELTKREDTKVRLAAVDGIASILTPKATRELIRLLDDPDTEIALSVARELHPRIPQPWLRNELEDLIRREGRPRRRKCLEYEIRHIELCWRDEMAEPLLRWATSRLKADDAEVVTQAGKFISYIGGPEHLPLLSAALGRWAPAWRAFPEQAERKAGSAVYSLDWAARRLLLDGARPPEATATTGDAVVWVQALGALKDFRPDGWEDQCVALLKHPVTLVRSKILHNLPTPVSARVKQFLPQLLKDPELAVRLAACYAARKAGDEALLPDVLELLRRATHGYVIEGAVDTAKTLGGGDAWADICADRLDDKTVALEMMKRLALWVVPSVWCCSWSTPVFEDQQEAAKCKAGWKAWLAKYRKQVQDEGGFAPGDARLDHGLFPKTMDWRTKKDSKKWP